METWVNGERASIVKNIIDRNFAMIDNHICNSVLALTTPQRNILSSRYLKSGLIVFDTDMQQWLKYQDGEWVEHIFPYTGYVKKFKTTDWDSNKSIYIPFSEHLTPNPAAHIYIFYNNTYVPAEGGLHIDNNYNITLSTDLLFGGKVVVK